MFYFSRDDPISDEDAFNLKKLKENPNLVTGLTSYGSHLCTSNNYFKRDRWMGDIAISFIRAIAETEKLE